MSSIDVNSSLFLYEQIYRILKERISKGEFKANQKIPSEYELSKMYGVNRHTVRKAIERIRNEGYVYTIKGKGTFISTKKIHYEVSKKTRFTESIINLGYNPDAKLIDLYESIAGKDIHSKLGIKTNQKVLVLEILRYVNKTPFCYSKSFLDSEKFKDIKKYIGERFSLYKILRDAYKIEPIRLSSELEVSLPTNQEMALLGVSNKTPLLIVRSLVSDKDENIIEYCITKFRGDLCTIYMDFSNNGKF